MFARYYYNLGCCCHTPVWFPARWISCCCVFPFHQAHSAGNVDHSTELHPWQAELQPAGMEDLISIDSLISFILEEGSFVSQTNSCKPLCSPSALCLHRDAKDLHVGRGLEGFGAGSCGLSMQHPDLGQKTRSAWCWGNALFGPKQVPFESEPPDGLWVIFAIMPPAIPAGEARLGPGSCTPHACPAALACLCVFRRELLACGHRQRLKDVAVCIVWPWTELSCRALWPAAFALLVLHLSRAPVMPLQCPDLFPGWGSCFQLDSRVKRGTLIFHKCQRLCAVFADRNRNSE